MKLLKALFIATLLTAAGMALFLLFILLSGIFIPALFFGLIVFFVYVVLTDPKEDTKTNQDPPG